ncbi:TPA: hypothetical protein ACNV18_000081 [Pseudomonas putida]|uniref:hypothetical protein n=1 Tax=Pseudomonas TaxID=286 RepID=UPI0003714C69|nr:MULTISPECIES: hypothetical protein [Pseudomonas]ANC84185.1 hypothetical protein KKK_25540 [Pseudomonas putida B6-2]MBA6113841.1 hypothetical protein [Pseudomonas asiatica]MCZ9640480.1 hypothetical protein [Pseudomonas putida]MCZ9640948.1 hypothetical protein [Pseudomonas putida]
MAEPAEVIKIRRSVVLFEGLDQNHGSEELECVSEPSLVKKLDDGAQTFQIVIAVNSTSKMSVQAYLHTLDMVNEQFLQRAHSVSSQTIQRLVEVMVPLEPVSSTKLHQAKMLMKAKTAVLMSGDWVTASEIASLAQLSASNPSSQPSKWKREKRIFAITHNGTDYFPMYGLDEMRGYRPLSQLKDVIMVLESAKDSWQMAYWFMSNNSWLASKRPQDLLRSDPGRVIEAAREEVSEISHG